MLEYRVMKIRRFLPYVSQGIIVGLAVGLIAVLLLTTDAFKQRPVVELKEAPGDPAAAAPQAAVSYAAAVAKAAPAVVNVASRRVVRQRADPFWDFFMGGSGIYMLE